MNIRRILKSIKLSTVDDCDRTTIETIDPSSSQSQPVEANVYQAVDALLVRNNVKVRFGGSYAFYDYQQDFIGMPPDPDHAAGEEYYSTLMHETSHWTGHPTRLNRRGNAEQAESPELEVEAVEELIAEIGSAFLCAEFGIRNNLRHEGLVLRWIRELGEDLKAIFHASSLAWKARCYLLRDES